MHKVSLYATFLCTLESTIPAALIFVKTQNFIFNVSGKSKIFKLSNTITRNPSVYQMNDILRYYLIQANRSVFDTSDHSSRWNHSSLTFLILSCNGE